MTEALYVHIPFCASVCAYCDFSRVYYQKELAERYLNALQAELSELPDQTYRTVYLGGGTPTSLPQEQLNQLLMILQPYTKNVVEYTIEINPETLDEEKAQLLARYGINRASLGVQSFDEQLLALIGRKHRMNEIDHAVSLLIQCGITNLSLDLMYGLPEQSTEQFLSSVKQAIRYPITHVSLYGLTIEEHSLFGQKGIQALSEEISDEMYFRAIALLEENGFHQYEISNFCKSGYASKHNLVYWRYEDFAAAGLSAAGKVGSMRYINTHNFVQYLSHKWREETIQLNQKEQLFEAVMMGLRLKEGIPLYDQRGKLIYQQYKQVIEEQQAKGWLQIKNNRLSATKQGYYILNDVLLDFLPE